MDNYPGNAKTNRPARPKTERRIPTDPKLEETAKPKLEKVVTGEVIRRKKPLGKRFRETFIGGEDARSVWGYILEQVVVPSAKDMLVDAVTESANRAVYGSSSTSPLRKAAGRHAINAGHVAYNRFSNGGTATSSSTIRRDPRADPRPQLSHQARRTHQFDEILLATRVEGNEIIDRLFTVIDQYGQASVSDLYEMLGITAEFTDENWGWDELRGAGVVRTRDGYLLDLPKPEPLTN